MVLRSGPYPKVDWAWLPRATGLATRGGLVWRVISVATISVILSVPGGRAVSWSRRVMRTWRAMSWPGGSGVCLRWSL